YGKLQTAEPLINLTLVLGEIGQNVFADIEGHQRNPVFFFESAGENAGRVKRVILEWIKVIGKLHEDDGSDRRLGLIEAADFLWHAIFQHAEVLLLQPGHKNAVFSQHTTSSVTSGTFTF